MTYFKHVLNALIRLNDIEMLLDPVPTQDYLQTQSRTYALSTQYRMYAPQSNEQVKYSFTALLTYIYIYMSEGLQPIWRPRQ